MAGAVKARGERRRTRSDWMQIEQQRGISVTSSVMTFERERHRLQSARYAGPLRFQRGYVSHAVGGRRRRDGDGRGEGHRKQTRKLFEVCRLRDIPIITFINKIDREGRGSADAPGSDRVGSGARSRADGLAGRHGNGFSRRSRSGRTTRSCCRRAHERGAPYGHAEPFDTFEGHAPDRRHRRAHRRPDDRGRRARARRVAAFDLEAFREGHLSPVFFGSALKNFGVEQLLDALGQWAPGPLPRKATQRTVQPGEDQVTGFVFKVQANMDPNHRDRVAFVRLCSGRFKRGMKIAARPRQQADDRLVSDVLFRAGPRDGGRSLGGRHHRRAEPRHAARRRYADGKGKPEVHRHSEFRAGAFAPRRHCRTR